MFHNSEQQQKKVYCFKSKDVLSQLDSIMHALNDIDNELWTLLSFITADEISDAVLMCLLLRCGLVVSISALNIVYLFVF